MTPLKLPPMIDECVACKAEVEVHHRAWEYMKSFWGKVFTAPVCASCEKKGHRADFVAAEITRRQRRLNPGAQGEGRTNKSPRKGSSKRRR